MPPHDRRPSQDPADAGARPPAGSDAPGDVGVAPGSGPAQPHPALGAALNLFRFHQEHERFYAASPLESALRLQRHERALLALADRWTTAEPSSRTALSPYEGADDLNSEAATALDGILFLEGEGRPAEVSAMIADLRADADRFAASGEWLAAAMQASWAATAALLELEELADVMGERHRIISNDWLSAHMQSLISHLLGRAGDMLEGIDFRPAALRADLAGTRAVPRRLYAATEVISRAADLCCESAALVHDNQRRWRVCQERVEQVVAAVSTDRGPESAGGRSAPAGGGPTGTPGRG
ncbi:hypothetical protein [Blastococcus tunisiensis]|uniref:Uncharacterized protein n=1 Tax=Blastococcus tunisiensis TaxID=1798228 RepID=A0A1I2IQV8_9ACTN|nr:hypothetical protein [Blastococcus sp. DSM 46838]SFF42901.1 hypothetical protein SAMN05216574_113120 [Blastococcus sp. DSM 46838]